MKGMTRVLRIEGTGLGYRVMHVSRVLGKCI